ncbi:hypothetical protein [Actinoplanes sp. NPDC026623]|uniref:hypothetical protein n=1 Tax=Actinoplanes sp. NPDC026623 TaxID=3155610 RepID=UPI0033C90085
MTRRHFTVVPVDGPVTEPVLKLGGQPVWLAAPQWPISLEYDEPMTFIGQFPVRGGLAYLFMTRADDYAPYAAEPEGGENAVIVQPDGRLQLLRRTVHDDPAPQRVADQADGPTVGPDHRLIQVPPEGEGELQFADGEPLWLQGDETPGDGYGLVAQLAPELLPFKVNFGDGGVGYVFLSADGREGRFLWQGH